MMHGNNHGGHKNRNNNNRRFSKNNNFKNRRFSSGGGSGSSSHIEDEQINPQQRRNFENKRDQHLMKAKEYLAAGERIEAENHFQQADHYHRMANIGLDKMQQQQRPQQQENNDAEGSYNDAPPAFDDAPASENPGADIPEIPVDMMGRFPSENSNGGRNDRREGRGNYRDNRNNNYRGRSDNRERGEPRQQQAAEPKQGGDDKVNDLAALPFMQVPIKES